MVYLASTNKNIFLILLNLQYISMQMIQKYIAIINDKQSRILNWDKGSMLTILTSK